MCGKYCAFIFGNKDKILEKIQLTQVPGQAFVEMMLNTDIGTVSINETDDIKTRKKRVKNFLKRK